MRPLPDDARCEIPGTDLELFARGELKGAARRAVLEHLLRGCPSCREALAMFRAQDEPEEVEQSDKEFLAKTLSLLSERAVRYERERAEARELLCAFRKHPVARQWTLLRNSNRFKTFAFGNGLIDAAFEIVLDDPRRTLELARMAHSIGETLDAANYTERIVIDLQARAMAHIGNAERTLGDLRAAAFSLRGAEELRREGSLDPLLEAEIQFLESSLLRGQRRFEAALGRVRKARSAFEEFGEPSWHCWCLIGESNILSVMGSYNEALEVLHRADQLCDPESMPRHALAIRNNIAWTLMRDQRPAEALSILESFRDDFARVGDRTSMLRLTWLEANLLDTLDRPEAAAGRFEETIRGFAEVGLPYEVGSASLEYAGMLAERGRHAEVAQLAADTLELFRDLGVEREMLAAWVLFRNSAAAGAVTKAMIEKLADFVRRAKLEPGHRLGG